MNKNQSLT